MAARSASVNGPLVAPFSARCQARAAGGAGGGGGGGGAAADAPGAAPQGPMFCPMAMPIPAAMPAPIIPPAPEAGLASASAALNCMYFDRSPATPIEVRLSNTFSTSSGRLMFST